jgi:flavodoxin
MSTPKILVLYYSLSGKTEKVAQQIHARLGGEIFKIERKLPYPSNFDQCTTEAKNELDSGLKPELKADFDVTPYQIVYIGSPVWWNRLAPPEMTFLSKHSFAGKKIFFFGTHGGGGIGRCLTDVKSLCPDANVLHGTVFSGSRTSADLSAWLDKVTKM